jgi:hypothetical protein
MLITAAFGVGVVAIVVVAAFVRSDGAEDADDGGGVVEEPTAASGGSGATAGIAADDLYLLALTQDDVADAAFVPDTYGTGFISNEEVVEGACEPDEARTGIDGSGRIDGYVRGFADFDRRQRRLGVFYIDSTAQLFPDAAAAVAYGDIGASIEAIRAEAEIGVANCEQEIITDIDTFAVEGIGDQALGVVVTSTGNSPTLYTTHIGFSRGPMLLAVSFTGFDTPREKEFERARTLALALDARATALLAGDLDLAGVDVAGIRAAEVKAAAARIESSDLPGGWTVAPANTEEFDPSANYELKGDCAGADSFILREALATSESESFESSLDETFHVAVNVFAHGDAAQSAMGHLDDELDRCAGGMEEIVRRALTETISEDGGSVSLLDVFRIQSEDVALPDIGDGHESYRVRAVIRADDFGVAVEIVTDIIAVRAGASLAVIVYTGYSEPTLSQSDRDREIDLVERVVDKLERADESEG